MKNKKDQKYGKAVKAFNKILIKKTL